MYVLQSGTKQIMIKNNNLDPIAYVIVDELPEANVMGLTNNIKKTCIASIFFSPRFFSK
jgi:hypothetical protein